MHVILQQTVIELQANPSNATLVLTYDSLKDIPHASDQSRDAANALNVSQLLETHPNRYGETTSFVT